MKKLLCFICCITIMISCIGCSAKDAPFNIANYIIIEESGFNEYGSVNVQFNYEQLYTDFQTKFKKADVQLSDLPQYVFIEPVTDNTLANGEQINLVIKTKTDIVDIEKITRESFNMTLSHTISTLTPLTPYNAFEDLKITTSGFHKTGSITPYIEHYGVDASWEWPVIVSDNNGQLSNGDIVQLTLDVDKASVERKYGIRLESLTHDYQVTTLISHLESSADLKISEENITALNKVIEDWVISGENDENPYGRTRTYNFETAVLFTKESDSRVCFIYHIEDGYVPSGYYVYLSPNYTVLADNENNTLISGDKRPLSTSFAMYDKETVRYTEKWGWGQDYERQGFMYRDVPYAGKATLDDMITYLQNWYDEYPTMYFFNN